MTIFTSFAGFMEKILPKLVTTDTGQTISGTKIFTANPLSTSAQSAVGNALTRRDFVEAQTPVGSAPLRAISLGETNLNTLGAGEAAGFYVQENDNNTSSARGYPINRSGSLLIMKSAGGTTQTYTTYDETRVYVRSYYSATGFTAWIEQAAVRPLAGVGSELFIYSNDYPVITFNRPGKKASLTIDATGDLEYRAWGADGFVQAPNFRLGLNGTINTNGDVIAVGNMSCGIQYANTLISNGNVFAGSGTGAMLGTNGNITGTIWDFGGGTSDLFAYLAQHRTYLGLGSNYFLSGGGGLPYEAGGVYTVPGAPGSWQCVGGFFLPTVTHWGALFARIA